MGLFLVAVILIVGLVCLFKFRTQFDQSAEIEYESLKRYAKVTDVSVKTVGLKGNYRYRTTVTFSDGFKYTTEQTEKKDQLMTGLYEISLPDNLKKQIVRKAEAAHRHAIMKLKK